MKRIISLGAGVQSSAMLLMALQGRFGDLPDVALFADTGYEPKAVTEWLQRLREHVAPFPIIDVTQGNLRVDVVNGSCSGHRFAALPFYLKPSGMGRRQCSNEYKIKPIRRWVRENCKTAEMWIGISTDEAHRMKPSGVKYITNRFPLIEANLSRRDCHEYNVLALGEAPKSSCIGCPFHGDRYWITLKQTSPEEFEDACQFDEAIRRSGRMVADQFLHRSLKPLRQVDFMHERQGAMFEDGFGNECDGVCGV